MSDVGQKVTGAINLALTIAARVIEVQQHRRRQQLEEARRQSEQQARAVQDQQRHEVEATRSQLRDVGSKTWWDRATPTEVAGAYATARAYGQVDGQLEGTARYMAEEIRRRYGVDADTLVAQEETKVRAALAGWDDYERGEGPRPAGQHPDPVKAAQLDQADAARATAAAEWGAAGALVAEADAVDALVHADGKIDAQEAAQDVPAAQAGWDDAARHETLAARLETALPGQPDAVTARLTADAAQGAPATAATTAHQAPRPPKARTAPTRGAERVIGR